MQPNKLFPVRVGELFRNALAVKRSATESAHDELYGLPGDRVPYGWRQVEQELSSKFSKSPRTIDEIIGLLREWIEFSIFVMRERFDCRPVLSMNKDGDPVVSFDLVAKGNPFSVPPEDHQAWYLKWLKEKTQLLEIEYNDWGQYWRETIESDETRRNVFLAMELGDALELLGLSAGKAKKPKASLSALELKQQRNDWLLSMRGLGDQANYSAKELSELLLKKCTEEDLSWSCIEAKSINDALREAYKRQNKTEWPFDDRGRNNKKAKRSQ
ncbi:MAG: hypothetical protein MUC43_07945 [Pirellula sp.]|jgi:hypothetical protein|nr:hypothetical protein [Pirellula sp.]